MKYIIVRDDNGRQGLDDGPERAILVDKNLIHAEVARCHRVGELVVVSAGFCKFSPGIVTVWGKSESIPMESRGKPDVDAILEAIY